MLPALNFAPTTSLSTGISSLEIAAPTVTSQASIFEDTFLEETANRLKQGTDSGAGAGATNAITDSATTASNSYSSVIEHGIDYQNLDWSMLFEESCLILTLAVILEMIIPLSRKFKLDGLMGIFGALGRKVNRSGDSASQRSFAGIALPVLIIAVFMFLVITLYYFSNRDGIVALVIMFLILELKFPQDRAILVYRALHEGFKDKAKDLLQSMVLRQTSMLSSMGIAKAASESAILRIFSGWFAVMVWYYLWGVEGAVLMQLINVLERTYNYKLRGNHQFGRMLFHLQQIMLVIPALLLMLCLVCSKNPMRHFVTAAAGFKAYPAPISGLVLGAVGGSLNIALGGPRYYQGYIMRLPQVGGTYSPDEQSILYAMRKIRMCGIILLVLSIVIGLNV